jgi:hypothetical protein
VNDGPAKAPAAEMAREIGGRDLAHMADAEREDQAAERDAPPRVDGVEEVPADFSPQPSRFFSC